MKITMETDYAFRIMRFLAISGKTDAKAIAENVNAPQRFTVKILGKLASGGVVDSFKGANGGYSLSRPADKITLREVFEIIEGPLTISRCDKENMTCPHDAEVCDCFFNHIFDEINVVIATRLGSVTVADSVKGGKK